MPSNLESATGRKDRRRRDPIHWVGALLVVAALGVAPGEAAETTVLVKYRSAANVYLDGGRSLGLAVGDRLTVASQGTAIAELEVIFVADQSASCRVVNETRPVRAGDLASFSVRKATPVVAEAAKPATDPPPAAPEISTATSAGKKASQPWARVRGGVSFGYYKVRDESAAGLDFEQRTGRLDVSAWDIGGKPYTFAAHFRTRQDIRARALATQTPEGQRDARLYELSLRYEPPSDNYSYEIGRIGASHTGGISALDGILGRVRLGSPLQIGGFFGQRADLDTTFTEPGSGRKYGAFLRWSPPAGSTASYDAIVSVVREFSGAQISREYLGVESRVGTGRRLSLFERAEIDMNRGWRQDATKRPYQLSVLSVSSNLRLSNSSTFVLSYDSRKNYRYAVNRNVPEYIFDDLLHQGLRASLYVGRGNGFSVNAGGGLRFDEKDNQRSYSFNGGIRHGDLWKSGVSLGLDGSGFSNGYTDGYLFSARTGKYFAKGHYLDLSYGTSLYRVKATTSRRTTEWFRFSGRGQLVRGLYLLGDLEYDRGDDLRGPRGLIEAGYQF